MNLKITKYATAVLVSFLLISMTSIALVTAAPMDGAGQEVGEKGQGSNGTEDQVGDSEQVGGQEGQQPNEASGWGKAKAHQSKGFGERVREMAGEKTAQIRQKVQEGNFTGKELSGIAKQMGVKVKAMVMAEVQNSKNNTYQKMEQTQNQSLKAEEAIQMGKATKYDYAYDKFTEKAREMIKEAKERGIETEELNQSLENVSKKYMNLYQAKEKNKVALKLKQAAQEFREKLQEKAGDQAEEIKEQARNRIREQNKTMERVRNNTWSNMQNMALTVLENRVNMGENRVEAMKNKVGVNTTAMEQKLGEIEEIKDDLEQAYESKDEEQIKQATQEIRTLWEEFRELHRETAREQTYEKVMDRLGQTLNKTQGLIDQAQEQGIDTAEEKAAQEGIENGLTQAKQAMEQENYGILKEELNQVRNQFKGYKEKMQGLAMQVASQQGGK